MLFLRRVRGFSSQKPALVSILISLHTAIPPYLQTSVHGVGDYRHLQALCSYLRGVLCLTAMLHASGVGDGKFICCFAP